MTKGDKDHSPRAQIKLICLKCGNSMQLLRNEAVNYSWQCADKCLPAIDTGVSASEDISEFERGLCNYEPHNLVISTPLDQKRITGAKVFAPHILIHFIQCTWGGCYNAIYSNFLVPYFDSVSVLDYVLRTSAIDAPVIVKNGIPIPKMFGELLPRLRELRSAEIKKYLDDNFNISAKS